jgi:hypothetical protein
MEGWKDSTSEGRMKDKVEEVKIILKQKTNPDRTGLFKIFVMNF